MNDDHLRTVLGGKMLPDRYDKNSESQPTVHGYAMAAVHALAKIDSRLDDLGLLYVAKYECSQLLGLAKMIRKEYPHATNPKIL